MTEQKETASRESKRREQTKGATGESKESAKRESRKGEQKERAKGESKIRE